MPKINIKLPSKTAFTIPTDKDDFKLHANVIIAGVRGSGKSVALANYLKHARDRGYFDEIILISPTYHSNSKIWDIAGIQEQDVCEPDMSCIKNLIKRVEDEREEWEEYLVKKQLYEEFRGYVKSHPNMSDDVLMQFYTMGATDKPVWKLEEERPIRLAAVIDDSLGTPLFSRSTAGLMNLIIKHRHIGKGLGLSVFMLTQSFCCAGGLSPVIRQNATVMWFFKFNNENMRKKVYMEGDFPITFEEFNNMLDEVFKIPHTFLQVDLNPACNTHRFRSGFREFIQFESIKCECSR